MLAIPLVTFVIDRTLLKGEKQKSKKGLWVVVAFFISVQAIYYAVRCVPMIKDIKEENYVCIHGEYYMFNYGYNPNRDRDIQVTSDDGVVLQLILPNDAGSSRVNRSRFPTGRHTGTVWYAKNSHYILKFIPDEPTDDN